MPVQKPFVHIIKLKTRTHIICSTQHSYKMFNDTTMCLLEEDLQVVPYNPKITMNSFLFAWFISYIYPLWKLYKNSSVNPNDASLILQFMRECLRYILLPLLYAYIWHPFTEVKHMHTTPIPFINHKSTNDQCPSVDEIDSIDKSILHILSRNPAGCTPRMIQQRICPMYPELEREDIIKRLDILTANKRASILPSKLTSHIWIPNKVKSQ